MIKSAKGKIIFLGVYSVFISILLYGFVWSPWAFVGDNILVRIMTGIVLLYVQLYAMIGIIIAFVEIFILKRSVEYAGTKIEQLYHIWAVPVKIIVNMASRIAHHFKIYRLLENIVEFLVGIVIAFEIGVSTLLSIVNIAMNVSNEKYEKLMIVCAVYSSMLLFYKIGKCYLTISFRWNNRKFNWPKDCKEAIIKELKEEYYYVMMVFGLLILVIIPIWEAGELQLVKDAIIAGITILTLREALWGRTMNETQTLLTEKGCKKCALEKLSYVNDVLLRKRKKKK